MGRGGGRGSLLGTKEYSYSGYRISFDVRGTFLLPSSGFSKNALIFGVDMTCSVHVVQKVILFLVKRPRQRLNDTSLTVEVDDSISFIKRGKKLV